MRSKKGFTLIELLIVISIIGIVVSVIAGWGKEREAFCFDGWYVYRVDRGVIHKLDENGKPIKCS